MINRILMELYDGYENGNIDSLIEFTKKTLPSDGTDKLFVGCVLILFSRSSSRYYASREELLSIVKAAKEKLGNSNYLAFYVDRVNREKGISKYLKDIVNDKDIDKCADLIDNIDYVSFVKDKEKRDVLLAKYKLFLLMSENLIGNTEVYKELETKVKDEEEKI